MSTPILLINQDNTSQKSTVTYTDSQLANLISCAGGLCSALNALPTDEGLDESTCYKLFVKINA